jgi:hypothetical protein
LLNTYRDAAAARTIIGHLPVASPRYKGLEECARETLHQILESVTQIGNNFFEATFLAKEGPLYTLQNTFFYLGKEVTFSTWSADFSSAQEETYMNIHYPIWAHFLGIPGWMCNTECLSILGNRLGKVLFIDVIFTYRGKTAGPQIKVLVKDVEGLPNTILLLGARSGTELEYKVVYYGHLD